MKNFKLVKRDRRHNKIRTQLFGTDKRPRLAVFKSNRHIYAQLIDDQKGNTLAAVSDKDINKDKKLNNTNAEEAKKVGEAIAAAGLKLKIKNIVFDRGGFKYHGLVKAVAEGARKGGLKF